MCAKQSENGHVKNSDDPPIQAAQVNFGGQHKTQREVGYGPFNDAGICVCFSFSNGPISDL